MPSLCGARARDNWRVVCAREVQLSLRRALCAALEETIRAQTSREEEAEAEAARVARDLRMLDDMERRVAAGGAAAAPVYHHPPPMYR